MLIFNFMQQSPSWEVIATQAGKKFPATYINKSNHYNVCNSLPLVPT
jgi:hypothetical protein